MRDVFVKCDCYFQTKIISLFKLQIYSLNVIVVFVFSKSIVIIEQERDFAFFV
jgi:hypothetical protein